MDHSTWREREGDTASTLASSGSLTTSCVKRSKASHKKTHIPTMQCTPDPKQSQRKGASTMLTYYNGRRVRTAFASRPRSLDGYLVNHPRIANLLLLLLPPPPLIRGRRGRQQCVTTTYYIPRGRWPRLFMTRISSGNVITPSSSLSKSMKTSLNSATCSLVSCHSSY